MIVDIEGRQVKVAILDLCAEVVTVNNLLFGNGGFVGDVSAWGEYRLVDAFRRCVDRGGDVVCRGDR